MADALTSLMSKFSSGSATTPAGSLSGLIPLAQVGTGVAGTVGNIEANSARNQVLQSEMAQMNTLQNLTPTQEAAGIAQFQRPLSQALTSAVGNTVQGQLSERGLSEAPGIYATQLSQALSPYQLQLQQQAQQAYFQSLGLPISARPSPFGPFPNQTNTSSIWQSLFSRMNGGGVPSTGAAYNPAAAYTNADNYTGLTQPTTGPNMSQMALPPDLGDSGMNGAFSDYMSGLNLGSAVPAGS